MTDKESHKKWYEKNREKVIEKQKEYYIKNKQRIEEYKLQNKEKIREQRRQFVLKNKEKIKEYNLQYSKNKYSTDENYRQKRLIGNQTRHCLVRYKNSSFEKYLGCSISEFRTHIESLFKSDMNFENYGELWNLDHIIPLDFFDLTNEEQKLEACNYKNIQPLYIKENQYKSDIFNGQKIRSINFNKT